MMKRRELLTVATAAMLSPAFSKVQAGKRLPLTGSDQEGPFYPVVPIPDDTSLITGPSFLGQALSLTGRVLNAEAETLEAKVEIWQCDGEGRYNHPRDQGLVDPHFRGFGACHTDKQGRYSFRTIVPVIYTGRPPHIHVKIKQQNRPLLTTQIYLFGHRGPDDRKITLSPAADGQSQSSPAEAYFEFVV